MTFCRYIFWVNKSIWRNEFWRSSNVVSCRYLTPIVKEGRIELIRWQEKLSTEFHGHVVLCSGCIQAKVTWSEIHLIPIDGEGPTNTCYRFVCCAFSQPKRMEEKLCQMKVLRLIPTWPETGYHVDTVNGCKDLRTLQQFEWKTHVGFNSLFSFALWYVTSEF